MKQGTPENVTDQILFHALNLKALLWNMIAVTPHFTDWDSE